MVDTVDTNIPDISRGRPTKSYSGIQLLATHGAPGIAQLTKLTNSLHPHYNMKTAKDIVLKKSKKVT